MKAHKTQQEPPPPQRTRSGMRNLQFSSVEDLTHLLEEERNARRRAESYAHSLELVLEAQRASSSLGELGERLLAILTDFANAAYSSLWLSEADALQLLCRSGVPDTDVVADTSAPLATLLELPTTGAVWLASDHPLGRGLPVDERFLALPLAGQREPQIMVCVGWHGAMRPDDDGVEQLRIFVEQLGIALEQQLQRDALLRSVHSRDEILGVVAHDLRNPLNVIAAASSSLQQRLPDVLARRPVERILRATQRAEHLIRDLLDINAIESGRFSIQKQMLDATATILSAIESQQHLAAASSVILASDLSPALPAIEADEERVLEVFENLLGNALKFTPAGGSVTVGAAARGDELLLWVKDSGQGMSSEQLPHLFNRFWQAKRGDRRGAGLGLTICRAIVEAHGGSIWAESEPHVGTTVFFTLPAMRRRTRQSGGQPATLLLVDDRPENLLSLRAILESPRYRLVTATSGEEALRLALRENFTLALLDVAMPGMDGFEVAMHLKELERSRDIPIIFVTAFGDDPEEIHRAYAAGGADYLVKPLDAEIVRKKVEVFVDLASRRNAASAAMSAEGPSEGERS